MKDGFRKRIEEEQFNPGLLGIFVNPFFIARKNLFRGINEFSSGIEGKTLDVGCGTKPYKKYFRSSEYIGLEVETGLNLEKKDADYYYDGKTFPFGKGMFDSVVTNQVLEHVFTPGLFLNEINRVLKPGGKLLLTVPFIWDEHEQPYDYGRYSSFGIKYLLEDHGFRIIGQKKSTTDISIIFQLLNDYIYKKIYRIKVIKQAATVLIMAPVTLTGILLGKLLPRNNDLYLDNIIFAEKINEV